MSGTQDWRRSPLQFVGHARWRLTGCVQTQRPVHDGHVELERNRVGAGDCLVTSC
jgi:hypothetical protein